MIKKIFILTVSICFLSELYAHAAQQGATENLVRQISPPIEVLEKKPAAKDRFYANAFLETSSVLQGTRWGRWDELTTVIGYAHQNITSYLSVSQLERFDEKDITYNVGSYLSMKDSYAHLEIAFGQEVSYMYKLQTISEYGHRLYETLRRPYSSNRAAKRESHKACARIPR